MISLTPDLAGRQAQFDEVDAVWEEEKQVEAKMLLTHILSWP